MVAHLATLDWIIISGYLAGMVALGVWLSRKKGGFTDFFLAGRTLSVPILIATLVSTYYGIDVLVGSSQLSYDEGVVAWFGYARPSYLFMLIAVFLVATKLKQEDFVSLPDVMTRYYGQKTGYAGTLTAFLYNLPGPSLYGFGVIGEVLFGWPDLSALL